MHLLYDVMEALSNNPVPTGLLIFWLILAAVYVCEVWKRLYSCPNKTFPAILIDSLCTFPRALKIGPWARPHSIHLAIETAIKETGLTNFGGKDQTTFIERYNATIIRGQELCSSQFSPGGELIVKMAMSRRMSERLRLMDYLKRHPSIEKIQLRQPIFVIGFPRTGTTFLHELLGLHPDVRMHYTWEQMEAVPRTDDESLEAQERDRSARYKRNKFQFDTIFYLGGDAIQSIHRIGYDEPEECTTPCAMELPWSVPEIPLYIFAAKEIIAMKGAGEAFEHYQKFLKLMTWQSSNRRDQDFIWMLKCPFHLPYLDELYAAFPGATVVWTHRDPVDCIASACSLYETLMRMSMEEYSIDRVALGKAVLEYTRLALDMALKSVKKLEKKVKVVHIRYADNVRNSKSLCKDICSQAGLAFSDLYLERIEAYLAKNAAQRAALKTKNQTAGKDIHAYRLEDYGLSKEIVKEKFRDYIASYNLDESGAKIH